MNESHMSDPREQIDQEARKARRQYIHRYPPAPASQSMRAAEFDRTYTARWSYQSPEIMREIEHHEKILHCLLCQKAERWGLVVATRLYVTYEDDPLKNYPSIFHGRCAHCNGEEMVAMDFVPNQMISLSDIFRTEPPNSPLVRELVKQVPISSREMQELRIHRDDLEALRQKVAMNAQMEQARVMMQEQMNDPRFYQGYALAPPPSGIFKQYAVPDPAPKPGSFMKSIIDELRGKK